MQIDASISNAYDQMVAQIEQPVFGSGEENKSEVLFGDKFRTVRNIFNPEVLQNANKIIDSDEAFFSDPKELNAPIGIFCGRKSNIIDGAICFRNNGCINYLYTLVDGLMSIQFDTENKIKNIEDFESHVLGRTQSSELLELARNGMQKMAEISCWANKTISFPLIGIIRYPITNEQNLSGLPWHRDVVGDTTMVVLLSPKGNEDYVGGGLRVAEIGGDETKKINSYGYNEWPHKAETEELYQYEQNCGFLFTNCGRLVHQAQEAHIIKSSDAQSMVEKRLFTILADTNKPKP